MKKYIIILIVIGALTGGYFWFKGKPSASQTETITPINSNINNKETKQPDLIVPDTTAPIVSDTTNANVNSNTPTPPPIVAPTKTETTKPTATNPVIAKKAPSVQVFKATITESDGLQPSSLTLKIGVPARIEITPKEDIYGCMSTIMIPELYDEPTEIKAGEKIVMEFTPKEVGLYNLTCAMGVPWGEIKVVK